MSRPSTYTPRVAEEICARLISGRSLRSIGRDADMPSASTVFTWLSKCPEFSEQYARAKQEMAEAIFWDLFDIADDVRHDVYIDKQGNRQVNHEAIARSKLRIDTRKWALARMAPKKYSERIAQEITYPLGNPHEMTDEQVLAKLNTIYAATAARVAAANAAEAARSTVEEDDDCDLAS